MADGTSEDVEEDVGIDELDGDPNDAMQTTLESAADGSLPNFRPPPRVGEDGSGRPTVPLAPPTLQMDPEDLHPEDHQPASLDPLDLDTLFSEEHPQVAGLRGDEDTSHPPRGDVETPSKPPRPPPSRKSSPSNRPPSTASGVPKRLSQPRPPPRRHSTSTPDMPSPLYDSQIAGQGNGASHSTPVPSAGVPSAVAPSVAVPSAVGPSAVGPSAVGPSSAKVPSSADAARSKPASKPPSVASEAPGAGEQPVSSSKPPTVPPRPRSKSTPAKPLSRPPLERDHKKSGWPTPAATPWPATPRVPDFERAPPAGVLHAQTPPFGSQPPAAFIDEPTSEDLDDTPLDWSVPPVAPTTPPAAEAEPHKAAESAAEKTAGGFQSALNAYAFVGGDDENIDLAKTQKFERRREPSIPPDDDDEPPEIAYPFDDDDSASNRNTPTRRRRGRKGRRRTVKIPDDNVPSTPTPAMVAPAMVAPVSPATPRSPMSAPPPQSPGPPRGQLSTLVPAGSAGSVGPVKAAHTPSPFALIEEDDIYDAPTIMREAPSEIQARLPPIPSHTPSAALPGSAPLTATMPSRTEPAPPDTTPPTTLPESASPETPPPLSVKSGPGIYTDETAISVLRPIQIVSDLPAMVPEPPESVDPEPDAPAHPHTQRRPPPPPPRARLATDTSEGSLDDIEEIVPERMSLPGPAPHHLPGDAGDPSARRPLPPPRTPEHSRPPEALADHTPGPPHVSTESRPPGPAAHQEVRSAAEQEADLAVAEARAREAEALAAVAEARAREAALKAEAARKTARPPKKPWFQEVFEDDLLRTMDNPKRKDVEKESSFIEKSLRLDRGSRLLDLCCGTGVHAVELASRGYQVVGVDLSNTMLNIAREYNDKRGTSVSFIQGDMRKLNLEGVFDGIYCWSMSFGYFDDQQNAEVLERVARALRPGGVFVLDVTNRDYVAPRAPSMAWFEKQGVVCMDEARFDFYSSRLITKRMVLFDTGRSCEIEMSIRLYTLTELGRLLQKVGFEVLEVSGHRAHRGAYFGAESPRIMLTAKRKDDD
jgi:ubiquinone/menaquinone biosynthesis C-methylase UbiE